MSIAVIIAVASLALALIGRDAFVRALADRRDARISRVTKCEAESARAMAMAEEHARKLRELEQRFGALMAARVRK